MHSGLRSYIIHTTIRQGNGKYSRSKLFTHDWFIEHSAITPHNPYPVLLAIHPLHRREEGPPSMVTEWRRIRTMQCICAHIVKMSGLQICNLLHPLPFMHVLINLITLCTHSSPCTSPLLAFSRRSRNRFCHLHPPLNVMPWITLHLVDKERWIGRGSMCADGTGCPV